MSLMFHYCLHISFQILQVPFNTYCVFHNITGHFFLTFIFHLESILNRIVCNFVFSLQISRHLDTCTSYFSTSVLIEITWYAASESSRRMRQHRTAVSGMKNFSGRNSFCSLTSPLAIFGHLPCTGPLEVARALNPENSCPNWNKNLRGD